MEDTKELEARVTRALRHEMRHGSEAGYFVNERPHYDELRALIGSDELPPIAAVARIAERLGLSPVPDGLAPPGGLYVSFRRYGSERR